MAKNIEQLEAELKKTKDRLAKSEKQVKVLEAVRPKNAKPTVEVNGKHYQVLCGERTASGVVTAAELAENKKRCAQLVEQGSGILKLIEA